MCDALSRNLPTEFKTLLANCLAHGRRRFVDVVDRFPEECGYVLETLSEVYRNDAVAPERNLSSEERLRFHQPESGPRMKNLRTWLTGQFEERLVEPNSALGDAISCMLNHWERLTLFLRQPGAPLDNNITERALKRAILHRKNALFYKNRERCPRRGPVYELDLHVPAWRRRSLRLPERAATQHCRPRRPTRELDAVELPRNAQDRRLALGPRPRLIAADPTPNRPPPLPAGRLNRDYAYLPEAHG
ncbi:MAG: transposase [bacterium]|nr:transposase [bacterium]